MQVDAKTRPQRCSQQPAARRSPHQCKGIQVYLDAACRRPLVYHDVNPIIFHGRIQILFDHGRQAMYLVDKQNIIRLQTRQDTCQVTGFVQYRPGSHLETHPQLIGYDV